MNRACLIPQAAVLLTISLANPAMSLDIDSGNFSQSRDFFNKGNQQFEQEIKLLESNIEPVKIKLPQNFELPQDFKQPNSWHQQHKLLPEMNSVPEDIDI